MIEGKFNIVFSGRTLPNKPVEEVKQALAVLFKTNIDQIERLFSGNDVTIKKNLDYAQAMKYQSALKKAGALVLIQKLDDGTNVENPATKTSESTPAQPQPTAPKKPNPFLKDDESDKVDKPLENDKSLGESANVVNEQTEAAVEQGDDGSWSVAAAGEKLPEAEKPAPLPEPDLSELSLGSSGEMLNTPKPVEKKEVDLSAFSLSEPGLLAEPKTFEQKEVETSSLSMADVGEKIPNEEKAPPPPPPDTSHLDVK